MNDAAPSLTIEQSISGMATVRWNRSRLERVFPAVLLACVSQARAPEPHELAEVTETIRREAFLNDPSPQGWQRAWCVACAALGGMRGPGIRGPALTAEMFMTYQISLTTGDGATLNAEVHASATAALARTREMKGPGVEVTIMGPNGEKLSEDDLAKLATEEA